VHGRAHREELTFGQMSTGAANDIEQATEMARKMVCEWGMSENLGPLTYGKKEEQVFLGKEFNRHQDYSENTALQIDAEIKRIVSEQYVRATGTLTDNRRGLVAIAEALLEFEVLDADQLRALVEGRALEIRPAPKAPFPADPAREGKVDGERAGGILPPGSPHPSPPRASGTEGPTRSGEEGGRHRPPLLWKVSPATRPVRQGVARVFPER